MSLQTHTCDRCGTQLRASVMSMFNTDTLCIPCSRIERAHPKFAEALAADEAAIARGDFNFSGIGVPSDLTISRE